MGPLVLTMAVESSEASLLPVMFPALQRGLALAVTDLGMLTAASKLTGVMFAPLWVWLTVRWSRKAILVVSAGLAGVVTAGMGQAQGLVSLLLLSCVLAAVCAGTAPMTTAILADVFDDRSRGRAVGVMYASIAVFTGFAGALLGQLSGTADGWRMAYLILGGTGLAAALLTLVWFRDPGVGAAEGRADRRPGASAARPDEGAARPDEGAARPGLAAGLAVFRVPSFNIMLLSRLLSGHLVLGSFGVLFLTGVRHFPNETAALVLLPYGIGVCLGNLGGAVLADWLHARAPDSGRVMFLQVAQFAFAVVACLATQVDWQGIEPYLLFWMALGLVQGVNPGLNRPIVVAVIPPELRGWAFVAMLAIVEPAGWAALNVLVSRFGGGEGLRMAFLAVLVGTMVLNALAVTPLYWTYRRDVARVRSRGAFGSAGHGG